MFVTLSLLVSLLGYLGILSIARLGSGAIGFSDVPVASVKLSRRTMVVNIVTTRSRWAGWTLMRRIGASALEKIRAIAMES